MRASCLRINSLIAASYPGSHEHQSTSQRSLRERIWLRPAAALGNSKATRERHRDGRRREERLVQGHRGQYSGGDPELQGLAAIVHEDDLVIAGLLPGWRHRVARKKSLQPCEFIVIAAISLM